MFICIYTYKCIYMNMCVCVWVSVCMCVGVCVFLCVCMHTSAEYRGEQGISLKGAVYRPIYKIYTRICMYTYICIYMWYMYTLIYI